MYKLLKSFIKLNLSIVTISIYSVGDTTLPIKTDTGYPNLIQINPNFNGFKEYTNHKYHKYNKNDSHTKDGSGSVELVAHHWKKALTSPPFKCEKNKRYTFSAYVKVSKFPKGQNVTFGITPRSIVQSSEVYWNNSKENQWEEVIVPFVATKNGECRFRIFTYARAFNTDNEPKAVDENGTNLDKASRVFIDDVKVTESTTLLPREKVQKKVPFQSSSIKIDSLNNFFIKEANGKWQHIFPKMIYRGKKEQYSKYTEYGFNGLMNIWAEDEVALGLAKGLKYFSISTQSDNKLEGTLKKRIHDLITYTNSINKPYSFLMYLYVNENEHTQDIEYKKKLAKFIDINDTDPTTGKRARPIYYLNSQDGLSRSYKNSLLNYMDITGSYIGKNTLSNSIELPKETLGVVYKTHNQTAPSPMIHLQSNLDEQLVPSIFYGMIQGGKGLTIWRDGGSQGNFQNRPWATVIKDIFKKIDKMLPVIKEAHWTKWSVSFPTNPHINIGTRDHNKSGYIILSNHAKEKKNITLTLKDIKAQTIEDYFTKEKIQINKNNQLNINIGYGNNGYRVLKIIK